MRGFVYSADSVLTCDDLYTNGHFLLFDCLLTIRTLYQSSKTLKTIGVPIIRGLPRLYQQCTNRQKQSKDSQNSKNDHWCTNRHMSTKTVPTVYKSSKTVKRQSKQHKNDHWCTNRHMYTQSPPNTQSPRPPSEYTEPFARTNSAAI